MYKIVNSMLKNNPCYKTNRNINVQGLMLHSVGCAQPSADVFVKNWNKPTYSRACVHAFIDANTGEVYQCLPWQHRGWHAGSGSKGSANNTHIGVETCESSYIKYSGGASFTVLDKEKATAHMETGYNSAVQLFAYLCNTYKLDPLKPGVIISHSEGHKLGVASNHADIEHYWRGLGSSHTMDEFRKDVKKAMVTEKQDTKKYYRVRKSWTDAKSQLGAYTVLENAIKVAEQNPDYYVYDSSGKIAWPVDDSVPMENPEPEGAEETEPVEAKYKVSINNLRIRKGPGSKYESIRSNGSTVFTGVGIFTIVEVQNGTGSNSGWGLLKAYEKGRDGWISLDYAKKL